MKGMMQSFDTGPSAAGGEIDPSVLDGKQDKNARLTDFATKPTNLSDLPSGYVSFAVISRYQPWDEVQSETDQDGDGDVDGDDIESIARVDGEGNPIYVEEVFMSSMSPDVAQLLYSSDLAGIKTFLNLQDRRFSTRLLHTGGSLTLVANTWTQLAPDLVADTQAPSGEAAPTIVSGRVHGLPGGKYAIQAIVMGGQSDAFAIRIRSTQTDGTPYGEFSMPSARGVVPANGGEPAKTTLSGIVEFNGGADFEVLVRDTGANTIMGMELRFVRIF